MTEAGKPKERPARVRPPVPLTALSVIDVPYGDVWTDFQISSRSGTQSIRLQDAVLYALTSVLWPRGWNTASKDVGAHARHIPKMKTITFPVPSAGRHL